MAIRLHLKVRSCAILLFLKSILVPISFEWLYEKVYDSVCVCVHG